MKPSLLFLTCGNDKEAEKIAKTLLAKKLVVCTKRFPVTSSYLWKGKIASGNEILLIMESTEENFPKIEKEVAKIHSYETFVLLSSLVTKTTKKVEGWIKQELGK
ncbi:divalent-cation tolerance protein CutA [Candidatus Microgenomates bacterium]|nr:divalent-cation tolerance protein CutA [Candidatus Microgenomates bacterium]